MSFLSSMQAAKGALRWDAHGREAVEIVERMMAETTCRSGAAPGGSGAPRPVVFLEGLDGVGKSTLGHGLTAALGPDSALLRSPPEELLHLRPYFDGPEGREGGLRRAFYALGNYACAARLRGLQTGRAAVVDRFWPSTAAYALAHDQQATPEDLLRMPGDLLGLLPDGRPAVWLLLELPEGERAARVRRRAAGGAGAPAMTSEEADLEWSAERRARLTRAYRTLRVGGEALSPIEASGSAEEVLDSAMQAVRGAEREWERLVPVSVNWHYSRECNYACKFCFHTAKSSFFLPSTQGGMEQAKHCLERLRDAGMKKLNFSGGEPFLRPRELGELVRFCKEELRLDSVSIVSNGSMIRQRWMRDFGRWVDILAISCDSFREETNELIGRGRGGHLAQLEKVKGWCDELGVPLKINSVINAHNADEDMAEGIERLRPKRWKVFQCLLIGGENAGEDALRDARALTISQERFDRFLERHRHLSCLVPEDNDRMVNSYLILDENLCFLNCTAGAKTPSQSLLDVPVISALREAGFDAEMFVERGGLYDWTKAAPPSADIEDAPGRPREPRRGGAAGRRAGRTEGPGGEPSPAPDGAPPVADAPTPDRTPRDAPDRKMAGLALALTLVGLALLVDVSAGRARRCR